MSFGLFDGESLLRRLQATATACRKCGAQITVEAGQRGATARGIERSDVVVCRRCSAIYTIYLVPGNLQLLEDVTANYPERGKHMESRAQAPTSRTKCRKCGQAMENAWACAQCGYKEWGAFWFLLVVAVVLILFAVFTSVWAPIRWLAGTLGVLGVVVCITSVGVMTRKTSSAAEHTDEADERARPKQ
jgi:ribosomal protein L37E